MMKTVNTAKGTCGDEDCQSHKVHVVMKTVSIVQDTCGDEDCQHSARYMW